MNDLVASSVCWTIATSWRTSPDARFGSLATRCSTIWACRTMLVRLWAGPSCIARAISRRRSSWAASSSRETAGGSEPIGSGLLPRRPGPAPGRRGRDRLRERGQGLGIGGQAVSEAGEGSLLALEHVDLRLHQGSPLREQHELRVELCGIGRRPPVGRRGTDDRGQLVRGARPARLVSGGLHPGLGDQQLDFAELDVEADDLLRHLFGQFGRTRRRRRGRLGRLWLGAAGLVIVAGRSGSTRLSPPAS